MKKLLMTLTIFTTVITFAKSEKHREHAAHAHGAGKLGIAFDNNKGSIDFRIPAESIIGFEHTAKSVKDKKKQLDQLSLLENKISEMLVFEGSLNCKFSKEKIETIKDEEESKEAHSEHSDIQANFSIQCDHSPKGSKLIFSFQKYFPKIKDLDVQILIDDLQKSFEANKSGATLLLKK